MAKSQKAGGSLSLLEHTQQVMAATVHFAQALGLDVAIARAGAALHDMGKAHTKFQMQLREANGEKPWASLYEKSKWDFVHRHEYSSLLFLPAFPKEMWDALIEMVVAHHKSLKSDKSERGLLDLISQEGEEYILENHLMGWEQWAPSAQAVLQKLGYAASISKEDALEAWEYAVEYCAQRQQVRQWSAWRGLLMGADHFASALTHRTAAKAKATFQVPSLKCFEPVQAGGVLFPLSDISTKDERKHTLVVAPTGAGKTNFLMRRCEGKRVFYTLPFQASINAMFVRFKELLPDTDVRLLHAAARMTLQAYDKQLFEEEYPMQSMIGAAIKVLTPHQLASIVFGLPGFEAMMLDLKGNAVILDEIHTYSDVSQSMVIEIVKVLLRLDCSVHIGTATMPSAMYQSLLALLGGAENTYQVRLSDEQLDSYNRHFVEKMEDWEEVATILEQAFERGEKVLIVRNTVGKAQETYRDLLQAFGHIDNMLIHSRFRRGDRSAKEQALREVFEGTGGNTGKKPCWVVATQVVEVSLDISFDRMITDCAPFDALIQRFGRINRRRTQAALGKVKTVHVVKSQGDQRPYDSKVVAKTFEVMPQGILAEKTLQTLLDEVYPDIPKLPNIDIHLCWTAEQTFNLGGLCNNDSSVLLDALEIDAATCILEADREAYLSGSWDERALLEIPVNWKMIKHRSKSWERLEGVGSFPFVVPQPLAEYQEIGLAFVEHNSFI